MSANVGGSELKIVGTLSLLYVFRMLGLFMILPVLMIYGQDIEGATPFMLGMVLGGYGLTQACFQIPLGLLSDVYGRKPVIYAGLLLFVVGSIIAAMSDSIWGLIFGRALQGAGAIAGALMALIGDLTSEQNRTKAMAIIGVSIGLSFSIALILGATLAAAGGLSLIFWVSGGLALVGMLILYALVPDPPKIVHPKHEDRAAMGMVGNVLSNPNLLRLNLGVFALHFVLTALFVVAPDALKAQGVAAEKHWHYYLPVMLLSFIAMMPFMYLSERKQKLKQVFLGGIGLLVACLFAMSMASHLNHWVAGLFMFFVAFNLLEATLPSLNSKQAPAGCKGTAMGVYSTCQFMGAFMGGAIGGALFSVWGGDAVLLAGAFVCLIWLILASFMTPPRRLRSLVIKLEQEVDDQMLAQNVPGVVEARWARQFLYLKVDEESFERERLNDALLSLAD